MSYNRGLLTGVAGSCLFAASFTAAFWVVTRRADEPPAEKPTPPATVPRPLKEEDINAVTLTAEAVRRLALEVKPVEKKAMPRSRVFGGEVTVPVGRAIVVSAPLGGTLQAVEGKPVLAGRTVKKGETLYRLVPLLTPEGRANLAASQV
ncbi:MAG: hypothetical protein ACRC33_27240, partial [Gemmataceae bacterium]